MTLPDAHDTARNGASKFGNTWRVYRLPGWPAAVYSAGAIDLPPQALVIASYPNAEVGSAKLEAIVPSANPQGSLFDS